MAKGDRGDVPPSRSTIAALISTTGNLVSTIILRQVRDAVGQLNPADVRETAERPVTVLLSALSSSGYAGIEDFLAPRNVSRRKRYELIQFLYREGDPAAPDPCHLHIVEKGIFPPPGAFVFDPEDPMGLVRDVLGSSEEFGLPLARSYPPFRRPVCDRVIQTIARESAVFSVMNALPGVAPTLTLPFDIPSALSETAFLTVNQIRMAFLIAAASDRPVGYREQKTEVASIIAGAFAWRAIARKLAGRFAIGGGLIPRASVAFAGTYLVGLSLERLYRTGYGYTREERSLSYSDALHRGRQVVTSILQGLREARAAKPA